MSSIAESLGIWRFGRLAAFGIGCSLGVCYGKTLIVTIVVLFGLAEDFNPHVQAFSMVFFAVFGIWGLARDRKQHGDIRPLVLGLAGVIILFLALYVYWNSTFEFIAYTFMLLSVFWNQNITLKQTTEQLRQRSAEIEQKNAKLEQASQMKSKFLASMSHELRTPLNAIIGFSQALDARMFGELTEKQAEYVKDIHESGQHLLALINDILDLSKIEAGRMELEPSHFDLPQTLESVVMLVQERAARHGLSLELDIDERLDGMVGDQRRIKQVLLNLLSNAVKFTPDGGRISVQAKPTADTVVVSVHDNGIGIAAEDQAEIFEEFRQASSSANRKQEGTGLGLALSKKFVEMHRGSISVESAPGQGSTFTVTLPVNP